MPQVRCIHINLWDSAPSEKKQRNERRRNRRKLPNTILAKTVETPCESTGRYHDSLVMGWL